jgi:outer membrane protein insertion porin family
MKVLAMSFAVALGSLTGCQSSPFASSLKTSGNGLFGSNSDLSSVGELALATEKQVLQRSTADDRLAVLSGEKKVFGQIGSLASQPANQNIYQTTIQPVVRAQSPENDGFGYGSPDDSKNQFAVGGGNDKSRVQQAAAQFPELATPDRGYVPGNGLPSPDIGSPNELNPLVQPFERGGNAPFPANYADLDVYVTETQTGRINFGGAYNSDNGLVGQFIVNETNFDITRWPRSVREIVDGTAWRGAGQQFRLEIVPGANLERYLVSFTEPYMLGTDYSFSMSAYLFTRQYFDWNEKRVGGRFSIGRRLTPDLSINAGLRLENVNLEDPRVTTSTKLNDALGKSNLNLFNVGLVRDTRNSQFQATEGSYLSLGYSQAFGDYSYARGDLDYRRYRLLYERPDGSGRHTLSFGTKLGFSGKSTPIFENYFAGGFSTLRGYDFRGAAPLDGGVRVGGAFQWLNTVEYMFPLTADDMVKGVVFCDFGTVEENVEINSENFRVAPGFGLRIHMPGAGIGAPLAFDFAFPTNSAVGDDEKVFSFYLGVLN